jgi:predicted Zn-dependent protease
MDRQETSLRRSPFRIRDAALQSYLRELACSLAGDHCPDVRVYPVRNALFNANMAPNGMMQIYSGLLLRMENEAQLATIVAHELGHYMQRHSLAYLRDAKSRSAFALFMGAFGVVGLLPQLAALAGAFSFSREQESEADAVGLQLMEDAGYDPREAATVWSNLLAEVAATAGSDPQSSSPMFATHPPSSERFQTLRSLAGGRAGLLNEPEYQARLRPLRLEWLDDELRRARPAETLVLLERMLRNEPGNAVLLYFRAETRSRRADEGDAALAMADLQAAVAAGGEPAQTHRALAQLQLQQGQRAAARESFERYLTLSPDAADAPMVRRQIEEMQP